MLTDFDNFEYNSSIFFIFPIQKLIFTNYNGIIDKYIVKLVLDLEQGAYDGIYHHWNHHTDCDINCFMDYET